MIPHSLDHPLGKSDSYKPNVLDKYTYITVS